MTPLELDLIWLALTCVIGYFLGKGFSKKTRFILAVIIGYVSLTLVKIVYKTGLPIFGYKEAIRNGIVGGLLIFGVSWGIVLLLKLVAMYFRRKQK